MSSHLFASEYNRRMFHFLFKKKWEHLVHHTIKSSLKLHAKQLTQAYRDQKLLEAPYDR